MFVARPTVRGCAAALLTAAACGNEPAPVASPPAPAPVAPTSEGDAPAEVSRTASWHYEAGVLTFLPPAPWEAGGEAPRVGVDVPAGTWQAESSEGCSWVVHHADFKDNGVGATTVRLRGGTRFEANPACGRWRLTERSSEADPVQER